MFTIGTVSYLNALPLYRTLEMTGTVRVVRAVPARLTPVLARGECDAALIPIVDYLRGVGSGLISNACIGSTGAVRSVLMFHRVPIQDIKSVAADTSSHTSVALLRVILADGYGIEPPFIEHAPDVDQMLATHDAALIIGDRALEAALAMREREDIQIMDLGEAWLNRVAHQPFVYAAWVARTGLAADAREELAALLNAARDQGERELPSIVANNPVATNLAPAQIEDYLRHAIEFHLTAAHRAGLEEFRERCRRHGLLGLERAGV